jgi:hypothetical protein
LAKKAPRHHRGRHHFVGGRTHRRHALRR